jgi:hypothetical protein
MEPLLNDEIFNSAYKIFQSLNNGILEKKSYIELNLSDLDKLYTYKLSSEIFNIKSKYNIYSNEHGEISTDISILDEHLILMRTYGLLLIIFPVLNIILEYKCKDEDKTIIADIFNIYICNFICPRIYTTGKKYYTFNADLYNHHHIYGIDEDSVRDINYISMLCKKHNIKMTMSDHTILFNIDINELCKIYDFNDMSIYPKVDIIFFNFYLIQFAQIYILNKFSLIQLIRSHKDGSFFSKNSKNFDFSCMLSYIESLPENYILQFGTYIKEHLYIINLQSLDFKFKSVYDEHVVKIHVVMEELKFINNYDKSFSEDILKDVYDKRDKLETTLKIE